jgi:cysteine-rich repeat protein
MRLARLVIAPALLAAAACAAPDDHSPVARDQRVTTEEDHAVKFRLDATDPDGDPLTWVAAPPGHGTVAIKRDVVLYTPAPDFAGADRFHVVVSDGERSARSVVDIDVTAVADAPRVRHDTFPAIEDEALYLASSGLLANDVDPDGDPLRVVAVTPIEGGTIELGDDEVVFRPAADRSGLARFGYTVTDGLHLASAQVVLRIGEVNDPPRVVDDVVTTDEDTPLAIAPAALLRNDVDVDGDTVFITAIDDVQGGTAVLDAGTIRFVPAPDLHGEAGFLYVASDGLAEALGWVSVVVGAVDDLPTTGPLAVVGVEDQPVVVPASTLSARASDRDGDPLLVVAVDEPLQGTVVLAGDRVRFVPTPDATGAAGFAYLVSDGVHATRGWVDITLDAVDDAPVARSWAVAIAAGGATLFKLDGTDVDSAPITAEVIEPPKHGALATAAGGGVLYTPAPGFAGEDALTYVVRAGGQTSAPARVVFAVASAEVCGDGIVDPPEACDDGNAIDGDGCDRTCAVTACGNGVLAPPIVSTAKLRWLGATCNGADAPIVLAIGGVTVLSVPGGDGDCGCDEPVRTAGIADPAVLALLARRADLVVSFPGGDSHLAWAELVIEVGETSRTLALYDASASATGAVRLDGGGGASSSLDLCTAADESDVTAPSLWALGEECDDGNLTPGDGCSEACELEQWGGGAQRLP